jgi:hypothetical protein
MGKIGQKSYPAFLAGIVGWRGFPPNDRTDRQTEWLPVNIGGVAKGLGGMFSKKE